MDQQVIPPTDRRLARPLRIGISLLGLCAFVLVVAYVADLGLKQRRQIYQTTVNLRHTYDITHNLMWGMRAVDEGYLDLYGNVIAQTPSGDYVLDYVPLRLLVMRQWAAWARQTYPDDAQLRQPNKSRLHTGWRPDYAFTRPLLVFSTAMEALAAIAVFLLVRLWVRRAALADLQAPGMPLGARLSPWRGCIVGAIGATMLWLNPAIQLSAHVWPSSDIWIIPFFLWAVLLGSWNRWFIAGCAIGIGALFKGQQLLVAPLFILWPLFMGKPGAALRWSAGFVFAAALIVAPWLLRDPSTRTLNPSAISWIIGVVLACGLAAVQKAFVKPAWARAILLTAFAALLIGPWLGSGKYLWMAAAAVAGAVVLAWRVPLSRHACLSAGLIGLAIAVCPLRFASDLSWYQVGFLYGADKFPAVSQFPSNTLPALLARRFGWHSWDEPILGSALTLKQAMVGLFATCLVLASAAMAMHARRRDRHFLAALCVPWLAAYVFMPRMHARYLIFPAAVGAVLIGANLGLALLDVLLTALAWLAVMILLFGMPRSSQGLIDLVGPDWNQTVRRLVQESMPDSAWALLLITLVVLYVALVPSRPFRWRRQKCSEPTNPIQRARCDSNARPSA